MTVKKRALVVDDEAHNREILEEDLEADGFEVICAEDGLIAWNILQEDDLFDVILLDRMMPNMNGIELISKIKEDKTSKLSRIPVIMQTAAAEKGQVVEGIKSGVYYYLTKPFDSEVMLSIVRAAANDYAQYSILRNEINKFKPKLHLIKEGFFEAKSLEDVKYLSTFISNFFPDPERVIFGISELLINAVEHGNLGIDYDMKSNLLLENNWEEELNKLLSKPENENKFVLVHYKNDGNKIVLTITDQGKGFNWDSFMEIDPSRATDAHGRGIALSKMMSFDFLEYKGIGNVVECTVNI